MAWSHYHTKPIKTKKNKKKTKQQQQQQQQKTVSQKWKITKTYYTNKKKTVARHQASVKTSIYKHVRINLQTLQALYD